jgi:hypothetical protein
MNIMNINLEIKRCSFHDAKLENFGAGSIKRGKGLINRFVIAEAPKKQRPDMGCRDVFFSKPERYS